MTDNRTSKYELEVNVSKKHFFKWLNSSGKTSGSPSGVLHTYVHPCVINKQSHIVYPRGLQEKSPWLFAKLSQYYQQLGYKLKEDQRSDSVSNKYKNQRRKWTPVILFTASLLFESSVFADSNIEAHEASLIQQSQNIELRLLDNNSAHKPFQQSVKPISKVKIQSQLEPGVAQEIFDVLISRYKKQKTDPDYIVDDFKEIANYYSGFPDSIRLINELKNKNWQLTYDEKNWVTTGSGTMMQVNKAVIHFNTRSAAQLRLNNGCKNNPICIASPADALLHELLHAHSMLVKSEEFIAQGGMNNVLYPYKHEYAIIDAERKLYSRMSTQDNIKRPQRREHTGRIVRTSCPTCIK